MRTQKLLYEIIGYIFLTMVVISFVIAIFQFDFAIFIGVLVYSIIPIGVCFKISKLIKRILFLEDQVKELSAQKSLDTSETSNDEKILLVKCRKCGREYDMDFDKCPYCDYQNVKKEKR